MIHITEEEARNMIDRHFANTGASTAEKEAIAKFEELMGYIAEGARDRELADNMRALWIERADRAEPFVGCDEE